MYERLLRSKTLRSGAGAIAGALFGIALTVQAQSIPITEPLKRAALPTLTATPAPQAAVTMGTSAAAQAPVPVVVNGEVLIQKSQQDVASEHALVNWTKYLVWATVALAAGTLILAAFTYNLWSDASKTSERQGRDMEQSLKTAAIAAQAMSDVALTGRNNTVVLHKQMRAYVAVKHGKPTYQESTKNLNFAGEIILENTGFTPARNVSYTIKAAVLDAAPDVLPDIPRRTENDVGLGPRQVFNVQDVVTETFSDDDVKAIMKGIQKRLFVWGTVTYDDVFGGVGWQTNFCHNYIWLFDEDEKVVHRMDFYYQKFNSAT